MNDPQPPKDSTTDEDDLALEETPSMFARALSNLLNMRETNVSYSHILKRYKAIKDELNIELICSCVLAFYAAVRLDTLLLAFAIVVIVSLLLRKYTIVRAYTKELDQNNERWGELLAESKESTIKLMKLYGIKP